MKKLIIQALIIVAVFFATWQLLNKIDWMELFRVEKAHDKIEKKLGKQIWNFIEQTEDVIDDGEVNTIMDSILTRICNSNSIDQNHIKLHVIRKGEINAFALPDGHLVVYTGLINAADDETELDGVICHEIAHIELKHVMQKLMREIGFSVLLANASGKSGANNIVEIAKTLSSSGFDRKLEKQADLKAVDYLTNAGINPEGFAEFMYKLSMTEPETMQYLEWVSTHPETQDRAEYIIEYSDYKLQGNGAVLADSTWNLLKMKIQE